MIKCKTCILSLYRNEFNKFYNTGARMLVSIYHMTLKLLNNRIFDMKKSSLLLLDNVKMDVMTLFICKRLVIY